MVIRSVVLGLCLVAVCAAASADSERALLDKYCVTCHNQRLKTGGLTLDTIDLNKVPAQAEVWEKVTRKLRAGTMPPAGMPRPDAASYKNFASWIETQIDHAAQPYAGRPILHRLNRAEYANAVRDLLALDIDAGPYYLPMIPRMASTMFQTPWAFLRRCRNITSTRR